MKDAYGKIIESMYWACRGNKQTILNDVDPEEVLRSIPDPNCHTWKLKLTGKESVDPTSLVDDLPIGPQMASEIVLIKPQEVMELVEEELTGKTQKQTDMLERAQEKVNQIKAKEVAGGIKPIDEVIFAQNVPQYNPKWEYSQNSRQTAYLATLVCRYMNEAQWKEKKLVLSAKALEQIYHTASS